MKLHATTLEILDVAILLLFCLLFISIAINYQRQFLHAGVARALKRLYDAFLSGRMLAIYLGVLLVLVGLKLLTSDVMLLHFVGSLSLVISIQILLWSMGVTSELLGNQPTTEGASSASQRRGSDQST